MRYDIQGDTLPVVVMYLDSGESIITEGGGMSWMSPNMTMQTTAGGFGKAIGRMFSGESIFQNIYTAQGGPGMIACASSFPGSVKVFNVTPQNPIILQKSAFLCAQMGVELSVYFRKNFGAGLFGGEGFILQKISGNGLCFAEFDGHVVEYDLAPGQQIIIDTGNLAAMTASCQMNVKTVSGVKNVLFGGEGLFNTVVTGPGKVWLQSMPAAKLAMILSGYVSGK
ncbi:MAG: TIGR00266 family protein [Clostridia bacterium]|nr:TIGR00266 family protein [Clostridia bacterium]MBQ5956767.1 TIGR00266 family protein [Clostridia bacterium]MBR6135652.1 TIGR00266 family protein [Clostridia bacterium]